MAFGLVHLERPLASGVEAGRRPGLQSSFTTPLVFEEATLATTTPLIVVALVLASAFIVWRIARAFRSPLERLTYGGDRIVLIRRDESGFGPGTVVSFDLEQDGVFADEVHVDEEGLYTISLDARRLSPSGVFSMRARSADGTRTTPVVRVTARQERPSNSASEVPAGLPAQVTSSGAGPSSASAAPSAEPEICACVDCPPAPR